MNMIGKAERTTQRRVIKLFEEELGYLYLGDWIDRAHNSNIEEDLLATYLRRAGYGEAQITAALRKLKVEASNTVRSLYDNNHAVYGLLRYGVSVQVEAGRPSETVKLI